MSVKWHRQIEDKWRFLDEVKERPSGAERRSPYKSTRIIPDLFIIKVQFPRAIPNSECQFALVYEMGRRNMHQVSVTPEIQKLMNGEKKKFFYVDIDKTWKEAPLQSW